MGDVWYGFQEPVANFEKLEVEVTIDRDVPDSYNLYVAPVGLDRINGIDFYPSCGASTNTTPPTPCVIDDGGGVEGFVNMEPPGGSFADDEEDDLPPRAQEPVTRSSTSGTASATPDSPPAGGTLPGLDRADAPMPTTPWPAPSSPPPNHLQSQFSAKAQPNDPPLDF